MWGRPPTCRSVDRDHRPRPTVCTNQHPQTQPPPPTPPPTQKKQTRSAKALDRHSAKLCVLARDVDSDEYKTLVTALCKEGNVPLLYIDSREKLGEFVGLAKVCTG